MAHTINGVVNVLDDVSGGEIEAVLNRDPAILKKVADEEVFMNEIVTVFVHPSTNPNDPPHFILSVNGMNQPVFRGQATPMRRKYLEVMARMKETRYTQPARDMMNPEAGNAMLPATGVVYPFQILEDKNPRGFAWLQAILSENQG